QKIASSLCEKVISVRKIQNVSFKEILSQFTMNPWTSFPLFLLIIFGLYEFVGVFGAQTSVAFFRGDGVWKAHQPLRNQIGYLGHSLESSAGDFRA
ncbi:ferrous iron transport protein B, partial [Candidatus Hakubella thermalkaliphila]